MNNLILMSLEETSKKKFLDDVAKLSKENSCSMKSAFIIWTIKNLLEIDDQAIIDEMIEIGDIKDAPIDFFYVADDLAEKFIMWGKIKFDKKCDQTLTLKEFLDFNKTFEDLENCQFKDEIYQNKSSEFNENKSRYKKRMILVTTGNIDLELQKKLNDKYFKAQYRDEDVSWEVMGLVDILKHIATPQTQPLDLTFNGETLEIIDVITKKKSVIGYIKCSDLVKICAKNINRIFLENPRESFGMTYTNKEIKKTILDDNKSKHFWKLNNGITATCSKLTKSADDNYIYTIENFKIVNGRQTIKILMKHEENLNQNVTVQLILHNIVDDDERDSISQSTNTQNPITPSDLVTNSPLLLELNIKFKDRHKKWHFEIQRNNYNILSFAEKKLITQRRSLQKVTMARRYLAFNNKPHFAIRTLEEDLFTMHFDTTFKNKNPMTFIIPHIFFNALTILTKNYKYDSSQRENFLYLNKRVLKFYVMAFIGNTLKEFEGNERVELENKIYEMFTNLENEDQLPEILLDVVKRAYIYFRLIFNSLEHSTNNEILDPEKTKRKLLDKNLIQDLVKQEKLHASIEKNPILESFRTILQS